MCGVGMMLSHAHLSPAAETVPEFERRVVSGPLKVAVPIASRWFPDADGNLVYPPRAYPHNAAIPPDEIGRILKTLQALRLTDPTIYLRVASINIFNGMVSATFSCDGSHYMPHGEFLRKNTAFWF